MFGFKEVRLCDRRAVGLDIPADFAMRHSKIVAEAVAFASPRNFPGISREYGEAVAAIAAASHEGRAVLDYMNGHEATWSTSPPPQWTRHVGITYRTLGEEEAEILEEIPAYPDAVVLATEAPEAYDGFGTRTLALIGQSKRGNAVRLVLVHREHFTWQTERYASGSHAFTSERMSLDDFIRFGDWNLSCKNGEVR